MQVGGRVQWIEERRDLQLIQWEKGVEDDAVAQRPWYVEVQEAEGAGIDGDLVSHGRCVDDADINALLLPC